MQAAAFKDKHRGETGDNKGASDPEYENITLSFRDRDQPKCGHPGPTKRALVQPRSPPDSAQVPVRLQRSIMGLYVLLILMLLFSLVLSTLVLLKNAEMSREIQGLKREFSNVSHSALQCQEEQRKGWATIHRNIGEVTKSITTVQSLIEAMNQKLKSAPTEITQINRNTQKILEVLEKKTNTEPIK
ncbi:mast cell-expressed membrane protein 1 [Octodon degus]|uniref:Mast cell-expressed membrane protein 1 n=1 Tax=Octodon degus TaxID=10160 RepID=A0A6P6DLU2_OCTDE|nr:mast cell-expressed membrane protein 1 [Octodon degus]